MSADTLAYKQIGESGASGSVTIKNAAELPCLQRYMVLPEVGTPVRTVEFTEEEAGLLMVVFVMKSRMTVVSFRKQLSE